MANKRDRRYHYNVQWTRVEWKKEKKADWELVPIPTLERSFDGHMPRTKRVNKIHSSWNKQQQTVQMIPA